MPSLKEIGAAWNGRPSNYTRSVWALMLALDRLPWPWGEELFTASFVARALFKTRRLRHAFGWAAAQPGLSRWRLAMSLCSRHGRFVSRSGLVGVRDLATLRRLFSVRGEEHLVGARNGVLFIGFHLGPSNTYLGLRVAGHRLTWIGGRGATGAWPAEIKWVHQAPEESRFFSGAPQYAWIRRLYQARLLLQRGESVFISADGSGAQAFTVFLPGQSLSIAQGWLTLRRTTKAIVVPALSHMEGRTQVVTIHPPLPPLASDETRDLSACQQALTAVLADYVRRFPDHCYSLAFREPVNEIG